MILWNEVKNYSKRLNESNVMKYGMTHIYSQKNATSYQKFEKQIDDKTMKHKNIMVGRKGMRYV